jgi:hypothetical protein
MDDLVLQRGDTERALPPSGLGMKTIGDAAEHVFEVGRRFCF